MTTEEKYQYKLAEISRRTYRVDQYPRCENCTFAKFDEFYNGITCSIHPKYCLAVDRIGTCDCHKLVKTA